MANLLLEEKPMRELIAAFVLAVTLFVAGHAEDVGTATQTADTALAAMVDTEQAFSHAATADGIVTAFLRFFADDAITFDGETVGSARAEWARRKLPPSLRMQWEPRTGDVSAAGDVGWLTGPVTQTGVPGRDGETLHACYLSVWRRDPDGRYRVFLDTGIRTPSAVPFPATFTRAAHASRYTGPRDEASRASLLATDAALADRTRRGPLGDAYRPCLAEVSRLHRNDSLPVTGRDDILRVLAAQPPLAATQSRGGGIAASADFGYTYGTYAAATPGAHGWYVRLWTREADGAWKIVVDVLQPQ